MDIIYACIDAQKHHYEPKCLHDSLLDLYYFDFTQTNNPDALSVNTLYCILLSSKRFCQNVSFLHLNANRYLKRIIDFWQSEKLSAYNNSLTNLESCSGEIINIFYHPLTEPSQVQNTSLYQDFSFNSQKEALEKIKHKSINDLNKVLYNF